MPRPRKCRRIRGMPRYSNFKPQGNHNNGTVELLVEEYEVLRLIDYEKLTQEECASMMGIARTSVQKMYDDARYKIAQLLIEGKNLDVTGGNYEIADNQLPYGQGLGRGFGRGLGRSLGRGFKNKNNN